MVFLLRVVKRIHGTVPCAVVVACRDLRPEPGPQFHSLARQLIGSRIGGLPPVRLIVVRDRQPHTSRPGGRTPERVAETGLDVPGKPDLCIAWELHSFSCNTGNLELPEPDCAGRVD